MIHLTQHKMALRIPIVFAFFLLTMGVQLVAQSQTIRRTGPYFSFQEVVSNGCLSVANSVLSKPPFDPWTLTSKKVNREAVCNCTKEATSLDDNLKPLFSATEAEFESLKADKRMTSYFTARMFAAVMSCLASELDSSLEGFSLSR